MSIPLYARYGDNILAGVTPTSTVAPVTSYTLDILALMDPAARILFGNTTVTITFTLGGAATGAVLAVPMHNLTPSSASVLTLTNGAGLSQAIAVPALQTNGFPPVLVYDFSALANRSSNVWHLVIAGNAANLVLGGAIAIYGTKRTLSGVTPTSGISWQCEEREMGNYTENTNEYGTPYVQDYETFGGGLTFTAVGKKTELQPMLDFFRSNHGGAFPSIFWVDPSDASGARFGRWQKTYVTGSLTSLRRTLKVDFNDWPRGKPIV